MSDSYRRMAEQEAEDIAAGRVLVQGNVTVDGETYLAAWDVAPLLATTSMNTLMVLCGSVNHHETVLNSLVSQMDLLDHRRVDAEPWTLPKRIGLKAYAAWLSVNRPLAYAEVVINAFVLQRQQVMGQPWSEVTLGEWYEQVDRSAPVQVGLSNRDRLGVALDGLFLLMCATSPRTKVIAVQCRAESVAADYSMTFDKAQAYRAAGLHPTEAAQIDATDSPSLDQIAALAALRGTSVHLSLAAA